MEEYTCMIPRDTHDGAFYRAVLALHQDLFSLAQQVSDCFVEFTQNCTKSIQFAVTIATIALWMREIIDEWPD